MLSDSTSNTIYIWQRFGSLCGKKNHLVEWYLADLASGKKEYSLYFHRTEIVGRIVAVQLYAQ